MAKAKSSNLPHYELLYIIANKFSENEVPAIKDSVEKLITDRQGTISLRQDWGKKKLAYSIKHFNHGYYQLLEFDMSAEQVKAVDNNLRLSDQILRHQIVKKDKNVKSVDLRDIESERKKPVSQENVAAPAVVETAKTQKTTEEEKIELQDLDDKLDKILDSGSFF